MGGAHEWIRERADEGRVILLTLVRAASPYVDERTRVVINRKSDQLLLVSADFGYMEQPSMEPILSACAIAGLRLDDADTSFFYANPKLVRAKDDPLPGWMRRYFEVLLRNAHPLPEDLGIRADWQVQIGVVVPL
jgi:KUP system potassium uptake protein